MDNYTKRLKRAIVATALLSMAALPVAVHAQEADQPTKAELIQQFKEEAAACSPDTMKFVSRQQGDLLFQPLLGEREADHADLVKVCGFLKKIAAEGVDMQLPPEIRVGFFHGYRVTMESGFYFTLSSANGGKLVMRTGEAELVMDNQNIMQMLGDLDMPYPLMTLDTEQVAIGQKIRVSGVDISFEAQGEIDILWSPDAASYSGDGYQPPYIVHSAKTNFGRFDTTFIIPAFGKGEDGRLHPIKPGRGHLLYRNSGTGGASVSLDVQPAATPLVSINGIPAVDPAMQALLIDGRAYVPLRAIGSLSKEQVVWHAATKSVLIRTKPETALVSSAAGVKLWIDDKLAAAEHQPILRNNTTYVPIRAVTAAFGHEVAWWKESRSINIVIHAK
ncbi:copper amine oxidase N-terminal domain-containing protein [Paenibacillus sp. 1P07SE]|uniref:copper amine oxidase N-terminal domain-containing protein n=1 Tax=Paenibacillus sp. 1P07SE TaxID=3132209 RepID=UPI0039A78136